MTAANDNAKAVQEDTAVCVKPGPCPCEAPCLWARRALDAVR